LLSGLRPARDRFVNYYTRLDEHAPGVDSLPKYLLEHGYTTISNGKVFHHLDDSADSWSEPAWRPSGTWRDYQDPENIRIANSRDRNAGPPFEALEVDDDSYFDGKIARKSIGDLVRLNREEKPFFLAVGFMKPHLPFNAPKKYWDLYEPDQIDLADNPFKPQNAPDAALHNWGELRAYYGIPETGPLSEELSRKLIHGYYACVSYTDAQIGRLLESLEQLGLADNTVVVLWGDHGWNLGEHGLWCKHCNFHTSLWAPMIVRAPGFRPGVQTEALTEFVDIYPSLCELVGIEQPRHLEGTSFVPLMRDPEREWKKAIFSRFYDGNSVRTDRYLYTEWRDGRGDRVARMLYDHHKDPKENINISENPDHQTRVLEMAELLQLGWRAALPPNL
jgi:arylsulfatase A-like enzyme